LPHASTFYITTPIYYVNGRPHIGHAYTTLAADVIARWRRMKGHKVFFLTGTDEHGQKVYERAKERGMEPQAHCDDMVVHWKATFAKLGVQYDRFFRTTDADHVANVRAVLQKLWNEDLIYRAEYTGWYHIGDEIFVTEKDVEDGKYDRADLKQIAEANYFFKMGSFHEQLSAYLEAHPDFIRPENRMNEVKGFLKGELGDLCISRPKSRMPWGIELPFDPDYVTYVWFDALLNYLTATGYHPDGLGTPPAGFDSWRELWPANFHLLGKDILTTHSVYWTTMLFGMGVEPAQALYAHGWWTSKDGSKMSKSKGNTIDVDLLVDAFGVDAARYFFLREIRFGADGGFSYDGFLTRYNADLANDLGNLAHRGLSMCSNWLGAVVPDSAPGPDEAELVTLAREAVLGFDRELEALQYNKALEGLWTLISAGNKYIDTHAPWALNKAGDTERLGQVLRIVLEISFIAAALLLCVLPDRAEQLLNKLGMSVDDARAWLAKALNDDSDWLNALRAGAPVEVGEPLFPRFRELPPTIAALFEQEQAKPAKPAKAPKAEAPPAPVADELIAFEDFAKVKLRAGKILAASPHPNADKLLVLSVDIGEERPRQIVAGIAAKYAPETLVGKQVVVVINLKPAKLRGAMSEGMLLAAGGKEIVDLVTVDATPGEVVR